MDGEEGLAEIVELNDDAVLGQNAILLHFYWDLLRLKDFIKVPLKLLTAAPPRKA